MKYHVLMLASHILVLSSALYVVCKWYAFRVTGQCPKPYLTCNLVLVFVALALRLPMWR